MPASPAGDKFIVPQSLDQRCSILVGPYGGYLLPGEGGAEDAGAGPAAGKEEEEQEEEEEGGQEKKSSAITLPYVAQDNLELLTVDLVERCLDSTYKGGDLLGQHPETGEDVSERASQTFFFLTGSWCLCCAAP